MHDRNHPPRACVRMEHTAIQLAGTAAAFQQQAGTVQVQRVQLWDTGRARGISLTGGEAWRMSTSTLSPAWPLPRGAED